SILARADLLEPPAGGDWQDDLRPLDTGGGTRVPRLRRGLSEGMRPAGRSHAGSWSCGSRVRTGGNAHRFTEAAGPRGVAQTGSPRRGKEPDRACMVVLRLL